VLYDALKKEFPEFLEEAEKKVSLEIKNQDSGWKRC